MSGHNEELRAALRMRHQSVRDFEQLKMGLAEFETSGAQQNALPELVDIAGQLVQLLKSEIELNERLTAFAIGMREAGAIATLS